MIFVDRQSSYPNRYLVTPESGAPYYVVLTRADDPITTGTPLNAETLNQAFDDVVRQIAPETKKTVCYNLLDNSDFTNPVNQHAEGSHYIVDRWVYQDAKLNYALTANGITLSPIAGGSTGYFSTRILMKPSNIGKKYTFAVKTSDGNIYVASGEYAISNNWYVFLQKAYENTLLMRAADISSETGDYRIRVELTPYKEIEIEWAAFYEGEYTAETLPGYHPKGYGVELAECRRYFQRYTNVRIYGTANNDCLADAFLYLPQQMRVVPTVSVVTDGVSGMMKVSRSGDKYSSVTYSANYTSRDFVSAHYETTYTGAGVGFVIDTLELSAEL